MDIHDPLLNQTIEGYPFLSVLGRGAFGVVYLSRHPRLEVDVAVKYLKRHSPQDTADVQREIKILTELRHQNVVGIYDAYLFDDYQLIMMELLTGGSLRELLANTKPGENLATVVDGMAQIADALDYVHRRGFLHLDLKPANILLDSTTTPPRFVLTDFGIARARLPGGSATPSGGTPAYMSPEHLGFGATQVDARSDIYSLGVILYEILAGARPFLARDIGKLANQHRNEAPPPLSASVPVTLNQITMQALAKRPEERFQSAAQLAAALRQSVSQLGEGTLNTLSPHVEQQAAALQSLRAQVMQSMPPKVLPEIGQIDQTVQAGKAALRLQVVLPDGSQFTRSFEQKTIEMGRSSDNALPVKVETLSRRHLKIERDNSGAVYVTDLGSRNGTKLDGNKLPPNQPTRWHGGQEITAEGVRFTLLDEGVTKPSPAVNVPAEVPRSQVVQLLNQVEQRYAQPRVRLEVMPDVIQLDSGRPEYLQVHLTTENMPDTPFELRIHSATVNARWYTLPPGRMVTAGETAVFQIPLQAPPTGSPGEREHELVVEAVSQNPSVPGAYRVVKVVVMRRTQFATHLNPTEVSHGRRPRSRLTIYNQGNVSETFTIDVEGADTLKIKPRKPKVTVAPGQQGTVDLNFRPTRGARRAGRIPFGVRVRSELGMFQRETGSYVFLPGRRRRINLGAWLFTLVALAAVALVVAYFAPDSILGVVLKPVVEVVQKLVAGIK